MGVRQTLGRLANERGFGAERRAVAACTHSHPPLPDWCRRVRPGTPEEDCQGVDIVVETYDVGDIYLQVKSSIAGKRKFEARRRHKRIEVIIVRREDDEISLRAKIFTAALRLRREFLAKRAGT